MFKVVIRSRLLRGSNWFNRNMTDIELEEYVEITREDIKNMLNNSSFITSSFSNRINSFVIKNLNFQNISDDKCLFMTNTYYGSKKIYFEIEDNEVTNFQCLDVWDDIHSNYRELYKSDYFLYQDTIFRCDRTDNIMDNNVLHINKTYNHVDMNHIYRMFNISTGYVRTNISIELDVVDEETTSMNITQNHNYPQTLGGNIISDRNNEIFSQQSIDIIQREMYENGIVSRQESMIGDPRAIIEGTVTWDGSGYLSVDRVIPREEIDQPESNTFSYTKKDKEIREFIDGPGMFQIGVKKFATLPIMEQWKKINELSYVKSDFGTDDKVLIDVGKKGKYHVYIKEYPIVKRQDTKLKCANPFIESYNNKICLGNMETIYDNCWNNNNYLECLKIIKEVLICDDDSNGYRSWEECK